MFTTSKQRLVRELPENRRRTEVPVSSSGSAGAVGGHNNTQSVFPDNASAQLRKKERSGLQSESTKVQSSQANGGLYASGAGRVHPVIVGWSTRNRPLLPRPTGPSMILPDARSLPHGLAQLPEKLGRSGVAVSRAW